MSRIVGPAACFIRHWKHMRIFLKGNSNVPQTISRFDYFCTQRSLYKENRISALHVSNYLRQETGEIINPYLEFSKIIQDVPKIEYNLSLRKMHLDVGYFCELFHKLECLNSEKERILESRTALQAIKNKEVKEKKMDVTESQNLMQQLKEIKGKLAAVTKKIFDVEDIVIPFYLKFPNRLHFMSLDVDKVFTCLHSKPNFEFKLHRHEDLGNLLNELEFLECSPTAYYLKNRLAMLELACIEYFYSFFKSYGFISHSNPDFVKKLVVEGSGISACDVEEKVFKLSRDAAENDLDTQHLVGGPSIQAFASFFAKQVINKSECLPQKLLAVGRNYSPPPCEGSGLFRSWQSTVVGGFVLFESDPSIEESMINEILRAVVNCYEQLELHVQIQQYAAHKLEPHESAAVGVLMYSPVLDMYWEVGRISICGDYISKRLLVLQKLTNSTARFLSMIHIRICNVTHLLALIMENKQNKSGSYDVPDVLKKFMYM